MMRYIVTILGLICLLACSNEECESQQVRRAVGFGTYTEQFTTRGELRGAIPDRGSMGVYGYYHDGCRWATDAANNQPNFMWNQKTTYSAELDAFSYSPLKYWPNEEGDKLSFIAYYPYSNGAADDGTLDDIESTGLTPNLTISGKGLPSFDFTVKDAVASQVDLLVSDLVTDLPQSRDTEGDPGTPFNDLSIYDKVTFLFHHALAKVEIRIVADAEIRKDLESFAIQSPGITLTKIYNDGTLTPAYSAGATTLSWSRSSYSTTTSYTFKTYVPQLLMPQVLDNSATLSLTYTMTFKSDGTSYHYYGSQEGEGGTVTGTLVADEHYTYSNTASIQLNEMKRTGSDVALTEWLPNHHYIYTIRLRANRIDFTGQVVEWGDTQDIEDIKIEE